MAVDMTAVFDDWKHDAGDEGKNVRCIRGHDGRLKLQVRVRCGIFQWEYEGRPDGTTPHGCPTLLDYYRQRLGVGRRRRGPAPPLRLTPEDIAAISEEIMDYYQRRVLFFRLGEYARARDDAQHNLDLLDILRSCCNDPEAVAQHEKWRPFVMMDRTRADALVLCQNGAYADAVQKIDQGVAEVSELFRQYGREDVIPISQEIATLKELKLQLREAYNIPLSRDEILDGLREEQAKAIADEDYERAARIRDEIAHFEKDEGQKTI
ncbi:MAG: hypothetical protein FJ290_26610 [Planctomycetes bacterium]|nr:hypothetical protein [Planctomycetota bacterium]